MNCRKVMDLKPFKLDIDELINGFAECGSTTFSEFKRLWLSRKFSFIFEASPSSNQDGTAACFSQGELRQLKSLVVDAKSMGVKVVSVLLKSMLEKNMFLLGFVGINEGSATERVNELTGIQNARVQTAYKKLFADSRLEHFIQMDMGTELDVDLLKKTSSEYAAAKELAIKGASQVIDVENIKHIAENKRLIGDIVEKKAADWNLQKELFYEQTGFSRLPVAVPPNQEENEYTDRKSSDQNKKRKEPCDNHDRQEGDENFEDQGEHDNFGKELEDVLLLEPSECDDEEDEHTDSWEEDT